MVQKRNGEISQISRWLEGNFQIQNFEGILIFVEEIIDIALGR